MINQNVYPLRPAAIDVDGVLLDCDNSFAIVASDMLKRPLVKLNNAYNLSIRYGITHDEMLKTFEYMKDHPSGWSGMPALKGAIDAVKNLQLKGYFIHLVTAIPEELKDMRLSCLKKYDFVPDAIYCAGHHLASKTEALRNINPIMMIDDRLSHLNDISFVPYRVWVDHGDDQEGFVPQKDVHRVKSLSQWIKKWDKISVSSKKIAFRH